MTTIQKLNNAISNDRYENEMAFLKDQKVIFIFDECHRSQFGETHQKLKSSLKMRKCLVLQELQFLKKMVTLKWGKIYHRIFISKVAT